MSRSATLLLLSVAWVMACMHTQDVEDRSHEVDPEEKEEPAPKKPSNSKKATARRDSEVKRPAYAGRPELATNATALMKPEGPMRIQKKLADAGYYSGEATAALDEKTVAALRKFQGAHDLARTGSPDRATLKALGLRADDIWLSKEQREKAEQKQREQQQPPGS